MILGLLGRAKSVEVVVCGHECIFILRIVGVQVEIVVAEHYLLLSVVWRVVLKQGVG